MLRALARMIGSAAILGPLACAGGASRQPAAFAGPTCTSEKAPSDVAREAMLDDVRHPLGAFDGSREVRAWVDMWNRFDLDRVDALFVPDARVTYFSSEKPGRIAGIEALREHHRGFGFVPGGADRGSRLWLEAVQAHTYGHVVVVTAIWLFQRAGSATAQRGPVTLVLLGDGGKCRIAHAHFANDPPAKETKATPAKEVAQ